ncbi:hypothetical protein [Pelagihabitans pacificus]|nr:hypothetical protein [Pelagihabitans pacificus]
MKYVALFQCYTHVFIACAALVDTHHTVHYSTDWSGDYRHLFLC